MKVFFRLNRCTLVCFSRFEFDPPAMLTVLKKPLGHERLIRALIVPDTSPKTVLSTRENFLCLCVSTGSASVARPSRRTVSQWSKLQVQAMQQRLGKLPCHVDEKVLRVCLMWLVHSSKGLECDHVILPRMTSETQGFPSMIEDVPVMSLAMPDGDGFVFSEERRLFYAAMARAMRSVRLITLTKRESDFVMELIKHHRAPVRDLAGEVREEDLCPECGRGLLVTLKGPYGEPPRLSWRPVGLSQAATMED